MSGAVLASQECLNFIAGLMPLRQMRSNHPCILGIHTTSHLTGQWPPTTSSDPFQRKARRILSMVSRTQGGSNDNRWKVVIEVSTNCTKMRRPLWANMAAWQEASRDLMTSNNLWKSSFFCFLQLRGKSRYMIGNNVNLQCSKAHHAYVSSFTMYGRDWTFGQIAT